MADVSVMWKAGITVENGGGRKEERLGSSACGMDECVGRWRLFACVKTKEKELVEMEERSGVDERKDIVV
ncbi:hypothetical protein CCR75_001638 [Bremia lactucae]|uniref:Uncharacterized protein n=1 Tax=Bremia lactucae TaxID=4779 RepID=A0A976FNY4_BRELC|nr:hypothetical protein CCR75_001638 [Bremia lactucae]